jgi:RimJ/RimL family protein N-acetyltransferase
VSPLTTQAALVCSCPHNTATPAVADEFETERLVVRDLREDELEAVFDVFTSNSTYLALTSGAHGEPGRFDLDMLQRDFAVARAMPGRHMQAIYLQESREPVGVLDWMEENPSDGKPWVGVLIVHAERQRQGIASEVLEVLATRLRARGATSVRAAVIEGNAPGRALAESLGFTPVSRTVRRLASEEELLIVERLL